MTYVDTPDKKQKHPHYEHRTTKLDIKNNEFSSKKFHRIRKISTHKKLLQSFSRIGMCINNKTPLRIDVDDLDKVCFILVNTFEDEPNDLGVGPLNDGYLIGLKHHRLGFKIFYLYNPRKDDFSDFLAFFMKNTKIALTVFYSGRDLRSCGIEGIEFIDGSLLKRFVGDIIAQNCTGKARVIFITDCIGGGSVFDINTCANQNKANQSNLISMYVEKEKIKEIKEAYRLHGIFTYYFCKIISECPNITVDKIVDRMNPSLCRFNKVFRCEISNNELENSQIYLN